MDTQDSARKSATARERAIQASLYVGSTSSFDPWQMPEEPGIERVLGVWNGVSENTSIFTQEARSVADIIRNAMWAARFTGNDCVLVTFDTSEFPDSPSPVAHEMGARRVEVSNAGREFEAPYTRHDAYTVPLGSSEAYALVSEPGSKFIAFTVDQAGNIAAI